MTPEQRETLETIARVTTHPDTLGGCIAAALADLDAFRAALAPVAQSIRAGRKVSDNPTTAAAAYLNTAEAAAVLAADGESEPAATTEAKPCPFCGGGVRIARNDGTNWSLYHGCPSSLSMNCILMEKPTKAKLIAAWNTRTNP